MKKTLICLISAACLSGCIATLTGSNDYIPIGPQNLSVQYANYKQLPVYVSRSEIKKPWGALGLYRVKNLPNNREALAKQIDAIKKFAAARGAQGIIVNQYFEENSDSAYPVTLAAYLVRFFDNVSDEDKAKIDDFAKVAAMETIKE